MYRDNRQDVAQEKERKKQEPSRARSSNQISCCFVSLHFLYDILSAGPVQFIIIVVHGILIPHHACHFNPSYINDKRGLLLAAPLPPTLYSSLIAALLAPSRPP